MRGLIAGKPLPRYILLYAHLAQLEGRPDVAWMALDSLSDAFAQRPSPPIARRALRFAARLGEPPDPKIVAALRRAARARTDTGAGGRPTNGSVPES